MTAALNVPKGQLKLDPKLSAIVNEGKKKGNKKDKKKNKKNTYNHLEQKKDEAWKKAPPKKTERRSRKNWANALTTGVNITWCGSCTSLPTASWANSTRKIKRRSLRRQLPTPLPLLLLLRRQ
jgi:hypothetical protein